MDFFLTEEQKQIKTLIKKFCEKEIDPKKIREAAERAHLATMVEEVRARKPVELLKKLDKVGLRQLGVPKKYGGGGLEQDVLTLAIASEEFGRHAPEVGPILGMLYSLAASATFFMTEEQQDWYFPQFMENPAWTTAVTTSEPEGATDIHMPFDEGGSQVGKVFAYKDGQEWVINGNKMFGTGVAFANLFQVLARTKKDGPISESLSAIWVPQDVPGLTMIPNRVVDLAGNMQSFYDNVRVPENHLIGEVNKGFDVLMLGFHLKPLIDIALVGTTQRLYDDLRDYMKERIQGGKPLIQHSYVEFTLGEMAIDIEATRAFVFRSIWEIGEALKAKVPINMFWPQGVFHQIKNMLLRVADKASDLYGGVGVTYDMPVQSYINNAYLWQVGGSTRSANAIKCSRDYETKYDAAAELTAFPVA